MLRLFNSLPRAAAFNKPWSHQCYFHIGNVLHSNSDTGDESVRFRSQEGVFNPTRSKEVFGNPVEITSQREENVNATEYKQHKSTNQTAAENDDAEHASAYNCSNQISLNAVMQSNVPEPFSIDAGKNPAHLNMPGGAYSQNQKYLSERRHGAHQHNQGHKDNYTVTRRHCHQEHRLNSSPPVLTQRQKLKQTIRDYGSTVIVFHVTISLASLGGCYLAISSGLNPVELLSRFDSIKSLEIMQNQLAVGGGTFVIAYAVHKLFAPVRIGITLVTTPIIVKYLRKRGILKPPKITT